MNFDKVYSKYLTYFNQSLDRTLQSLDDSAPSILKDAMSYATIDGGKRIRPILCFAMADILGIDYTKVTEYALAIEFIHSYSLVHDDLPCMDNDDYRRGKLSTHKKFGYANGVLTGDALLNFAFELCLSRADITSCDVNATRIISSYAGYSGMIKGQILDLENECNPNIDEQVLYDIYINKTSKLLTAPLLVASAMANNLYFEQLKEFGFNLGIMFQITDDLLDEESDLATIGKTVHKDKEADKFTAIKVFGLENARKKAKEHYQICKNILSNIPNAQFLGEFLDRIYFRKK